MYFQEIIPFFIWKRERFRDLNRRYFSASPFFKHKYFYDLKTQSLAFCTSMFLFILFFTKQMREKREMKEHKVVKEIWCNESHSYKILFPFLFLDQIKTHKKYWITYIYVPLYLKYMILNSHIRRFFWLVIIQIRILFY